MVTQEAYVKAVIGSLAIGKKSGVLMPYGVVAGGWYKQCSKSLSYRLPTAINAK